MIEIIKITDKESIYITTICEWLLNFWGENEGFSPEKMYDYVTNSLCENRIPQTFAVLYNNTLAGMYQISMSDIDVRPDIYPWLINVFVNEKFRGKGIMREIMKSVRENMKILNIDTLYLYTKHTSLYEKFDCEFIESFKTYISPDDVQRLYCIKIKP